MSPGVTGPPPELAPESGGAPPASFRAGGGGPPLDASSPAPELLEPLERGVPASFASTAPLLLAPELLLLPPALLPGAGAPDPVPPLDDPPLVLPLLPLPPEEPPGTTTAPPLPELPPAADPAPLSCGALEHALLDAAPSSIPQATKGGGRQEWSSFPSVEVRRNRIMAEL